MTKEITKGLLSPLIFHQALAKQFNTNTNNNNNNGNHQQKGNTIVEASGHFANNQIKDGLVEWIQGGLWNLKIKSLLGDNTSINNSENKPNMTAEFNANFTMIKPDGSLSHNHLINNFSSTNVVLTGTDIIITGIADIHSTNGNDYKHVPMTIHLMGKKVLGLTIDVSKTKGHFASTNEMYGTLISGTGLDSSSTNNVKNISKT